MIFFDLDGTLLDDQTATARGLDALHAGYAKSMSCEREKLDAVWQQLLEQYFPPYLSGKLSMLEQRRARIRGIFAADPSRISDDAVDAAFATYLDAYERSWTCFPDVFPTLTRLSHSRLGVITNGNKAQQLKKLEQARLAPFFTTVVTSDDCGVAKPDPSVFVEACRRAGVSSANAVHVGDRWDTDVQGSRAAGLQVVWLRRGGPDVQALQPGVQVIGTLFDLPAALATSRLSG